MPPRRTKIVATLGPATDGEGSLDRLVAAGIDVARLNLSHDSHERHRERAFRLRASAHALGRDVAVLVDLQGPKIRIGRFATGAIRLADGDRFDIDANCPLDGGDAHRVGTTYRALADDVARGDSLILDDGAIELWVEEVAGGAIRCKVVMGGVLSDNKGINKRGGGLSAPALTDKDIRDIRFAAEIQADYLAISFVRGPEDVRQARAILADAGGQGGIVAKIERAEALAVIDDIILAADAIMIARGDLGVEIGDAELPSVQKDLVHRARSLNSVVITATQMMQSMIEHPGADSGRGLRCGQCRSGRYGCGHALRRDLGGGPTLSRRWRPCIASAWKRKRMPSSPAPIIAWTRSLAVWTRPSPWPPCTPPTTWG
jgi:pyruvate kinase